MKKKMLCLACAAVMGLGMSTTAFAKVGSGDVNGDGILTAADSAYILQYCLDSTFTADDFNPDEANYDGTTLADSGKDKITANDAAFVLQQVLDPQFDTYLTVIAGKEAPITFTEVINPAVTNPDGTGYFEKTKAIDFTDSIFSGKYDEVINSKVHVANDFIDNIEFAGESGNTTSIRTDIGWGKFANAVSDVVTSEGAFAELENSIKNNRYASVDDIKADYETAKAAFAPSDVTTSGAILATGDKVIAITGEDFITLTKLYYDEDKKEYLPITGEGATMTLREIIQTVADNNLQDYNTVTIDQVADAFGGNVLVTAQNPNNGYTNQVIITLERR